MNLGKEDTTVSQREWLLSGYSPVQGNNHSFTTSDIYLILLCLEFLQISFSWIKNMLVHTLTHTHSHTHTHTHTHTLSLPRSEHERHAVQCPYVRGEYTENVPLSVTESSHPALESGSKNDTIVCISTSIGTGLVAVGMEHGTVTIWDVDRGLYIMVSA